MYGDKQEYDGFHGISVYNRTTQTKEESDDSTFLNPEFSRYTIKKEKDEWIVAVGKHEGFIPSTRWVAAQKLKDEIAEKYNRPHRATNALLAGIIYCPLCGRKLSVVSESNRYTHGKPRFKYACPGAVRKGICTYQAVRGVELDEYVVAQLNSLKEDDNQYVKMIRSEAKKLKLGDKNEQDIATLKKEIDKLEKDIMIQVKNLKDVSDALKPYVQADMDNMAKEIADKKKQLQKLDAIEKQRSDQYNDLSKTLEIAMNFEEMTKGESPEVVVSAIRNIVDRIIVTQDGKDSRVNLFLKGETTESYDDFFVYSDSLIDAESCSDQLCDLEGCRKLYPYFCRSAIKS